MKVNPRRRPEQAQAVAFPGGASDAFGRHRMSQPHILLSAVQAEDDLPGIFETVDTTGGSWTHSVDEASGTLDVDTTSGASVIRQTYEYYRYRAFNSTCIALTGHLNATKANLAQRVGYFDAENGIFLEDDGAGLGVVVRTKTNGSIVNNRAERADWDDPLNGDGPSRRTVDFTKHWILIIDFQWLGVGKVRVGINIDGATIYLLSIEHAGSGTLPYMSTPHLPVRYEIVNTGVTASASSMRQICASIVREGAAEDPGFATTLINTAPYTATTTLTSILAVRPDEDHKRRNSSPLSVDIFNTGNNGLRWYLLKNPTYTGTFTWVTPPTGDAEFDVSESNLAITLASGRPTGIVLDAGHVAASAQGGRGTIGSKEVTGESKLASNHAGTRDILVLCVETVSSTSACEAGIKIKEVI